MRQHAVIAAVTPGVLISPGSVGRHKQSTEQALSTEKQFRPAAPRRRYILGISSAIDGVLSAKILPGTDNFSLSLLADMQTDFTYLTSTLQPLRMTAALRDAAASALVPPSKIKVSGRDRNGRRNTDQKMDIALQDLLYLLLVADGKIVTLLRPRRHSVHPSGGSTRNLLAFLQRTNPLAALSDLLLVLNMLKTSAALRTQETWLPVCLPKFNPDGFVYTFISYVRPEIGLVFLSADREGFVELREWKEAVLTVCFISEQ
jgi:hypothetical protein